MTLISVAIHAKTAVDTDTTFTKIIAATTTTTIWTVHTSKLTFLTIINAGTTTTPVVNTVAAISKTTT